MAGAFVHSVAKAGCVFESLHRNNDCAVCELRTMVRPVSKRRAEQIVSRQRSSPIAQSSSQNESRMSTFTAGVRVVLVPIARRLMSSTGIPAWYSWLTDQLALSNIELHVMSDFPDPYEYNSKRWEQTWLDYIRRAANCEDLGSSAKVVLIGHGSGADAVLRFLEDDVHVSFAILISPTDEYYAGERHGRAYHWNAIASSCQKPIYVLISSTATATALAEAHTVAAKLGTDALFVRTDALMDDPHLVASSELRNLRELLDDIL
mmetsp:Transcript_1311/g.3603  ORF Transcript_1311/g.3603 Transcript_1311/m.3603 type:complete len:263 (-) Transcript_1311:125-913(-)